MVRTALALLALAGCAERPPQQPLPDDIESVWGIRPAAPTETEMPYPEPGCGEEPCAPPLS